MSLTPFLVLSFAMAASVGFLASFLVRAGLKKPEQNEADQASVLARHGNNSGHGELK